MANRIPPVGYPVQWFGGVKDSDMTPASARVVTTYPNGMVDLMVDTRNGGRIKETVPHIASDKARDDDKWVAACGVWDYIPGMPKLDANAPEPKDKVGK